MKKILLLALLLTPAVFSFAQKVKVGVHAGANFSNLSISMSNLNIKGNTKTGLIAGVSAEIPLTAGLYLQPELSFSQQGTKYNVPYGVISSQFPGALDSSNWDLKSTLNYLSLPVLVKYKIPNTGLGIYIGPQYSYLIGAQDSFKSKREKHEVDSKKDYKSSDFSGVAGAEYFFPIGIGISARYQLGLTSIQDAGGSTVKNRTFTVTAGYRF
ncbi:porin family protein [Chitinophaga defluvii]|uniref:Porin family protein n=1 Tax=Chitinophaga defluvii TaxID=3163343 RepID=A0ABV2T632_9BACT